MKELQVFKSEDFGNVRTAEENGRILFCGSDVAKALGYALPRKAIIDHCKGVLKRNTPTNGGMQEMAFIPEGDVYRLITHSKLPAADKFERWVFDEVLPSIRRTGGYTLPRTLPEALRMAAELAEKAESLETENEKQRQIIGELKPKADYTDRILQNKGLVTITQIAKDYGMSGQGMNALLNKLCIQYKSSGGQWLLYSKYQAKGYTHSNTIDFTRADGSRDVRMETKWTQKGRLFLYEKLKKHGHLPVIEREG